MGDQGDALRQTPLAARFDPITLHLTIGLPLTNATTATDATAATTAAAAPGIEVVSELSAGRVARVPVGITPSTREKKWARIAEECGFHPWKDRGRIFRDSIV